MVKKYANPWNLTNRQAAAMDAMVQHGCAKRAADALGISIKTIEAHTAEAGLKMGRATRLAKYLQWDRWRRGASPASGEAGNG